MGFFSPSTALRAAAAVLLVLGAAACDQGGTGDEAVQLKFFFWGGDKRIELTEKVLDLYHRRHPEISFSVAAQPNSGYFDTLATRIDAATRRTCSRSTTTTSPSSPSGTTFSTSAPTSRTTGST